MEDAGSRWTRADEQQAEMQGRRRRSQEFLPSGLLFSSPSLSVKLPAPAVNAAKQEIFRARAYMRSLSAAGLLARTSAQFPTHPWSISHPFPADSHPASAAVL